MHRRDSVPRSSSDASKLFQSIVIPETYAPTLLRRRAALLQKVTGKVYRAPSDAKGLLSIKALMKTSLSRPWKLLYGVFI